jgi:hypothetical protein
MYNYMSAAFLSGNNLAIRRAVLSAFHYGGEVSFIVEVWFLL